MSSDSASVNRMLLDQFEGVLSHLLPAGKRVGNEWKVGGINGAAGESMQITMVGPAAGRFKDFSDPECKGASPLWLWSKVRGIPFSNAVKEAKEYLGVKDEDFGIKKGRQKSYAKPENAGIKILEPNTPVMDYLVSERRLDPIVIVKAKIREAQDGAAICFPFFETDETGATVNVHRKYLNLERPNGKKVSWASKGTKRCLYGKNLIDDNVSEITITEGEIDALSFHSWGIPAVSIPNGVADFEWVDIDWEWLARFERINVCMDMDEPGKACANEICKRLGLHRCFIVALPKKDVNECLTAGEKREDMVKCLASAKAIELDEIKRPDDFRKEVADYYETDPSSIGWETPWTETLNWRLRKSEFTVWSGFSGHGKALCVNTRIPTPTGWTTMGALMPGDKVLDENGKPCNVVFATPFQLDRICYQVEFSDGSKIIADAEHLWETWSPHARNSQARKNKRGELKPHGTSQDNKRAMPSVVNTQTIKDSLIQTGWKGSSHKRHAVAVAKALDLPEVRLPLEPYCLGAWLGDGNTDGGRITCGNGDESILDKFRYAGFIVTTHKPQPNKCPQYGILGLNQYLREAGVIGNKHIPATYLRASYAQRIALLRGLMDTDGCITPYGRCEFTSMDKVLADGVFELVCSLGMRPTVTTGRAMLNGVDHGTKYRVFFTPSINVFTLDRKSIRTNTACASRRNYRYIVSVTAVASTPVKCIQVDSPKHLYLCGDAMIPTHNTAGLNQLMLHLVSQGAKIMDASLEIKPGMTLYNMTRCALGRKHSSRDEVEGCITWLDQSMFFLDCIGTVSITRLMHAMEYARKRHGIDVFIIDSLFKCGLSSEDYGGQREFADKLTTFCNNTGAHVILVAHSRKTSNGNEQNPPTKSDVAGSSDLTNAAFNVIIFWRNKIKKVKIDEAKAVNDIEEMSKWLDQPDGKIIVDKQRFGEGEEGSIHAWFEKESCQFHVVQGKSVPYFIKST